MIGSKTANIVDNSTESMVATADSVEKGAKMPENKLETILKARIDAVSSDFEDLQSQFQDIEWKMDEINSAMEDLNELVELLQKLEKIMGITLV